MNKGQFLKVSRIIWSALLGSQLMLVFILFQVHTGTELNLSAAFPDPSSPIEFPLLLVAMGSFAMAWYLPRVILKKTKELKAETESPVPIDRIYPVVYTPWVLKLALLESITLLGFVIAHQSGVPAKIFPFLVVGLIFHMQNSPNETYFRDFYESV